MGNSVSQESKSVDLSKIQLVDLVKIRDKLFPCSDMIPEASNYEYHIRYKNICHIFDVPYISTTTLYNHLRLSGATEKCFLWFNPDQLKELEKTVLAESQK